MEQVHNRMPVILNKGEEDIWLNEETDVKTLHSLLDPFEESYMTDYIVSSDVNKPMNDFPAVINPLN